MTAICDRRDLRYNHGGRLSVGAVFSRIHQCGLLLVVTHGYPFGERSSSACIRPGYWCFHGFGITSLGCRPSYDAGKLSATRIGLSSPWFHDDP